MFNDLTRWIEIGLQDIRDLSINGMTSDYNIVAKPIYRLLDASVQQVGHSRRINHLLKMDVALELVECCRF